MDFFELEESRAEAASALGNSSQVALVALADGISMAAARRKLLRHVAAVPLPLSSEAQALRAAENLDSPVPGSDSSSSAGGPPVGDYSGQYTDPQDYMLLRRESAASQGQIVAYIRSPLYADPAYPRQTHSR